MRFVSGKFLFSFVLERYWIITMFNIPIPFVFYYFFVADNEILEVIYNISNTKILSVPKKTILSSADLEGMQVSCTILEDATYWTLLC